MEVRFGGSKGDQGRKGAVLVRATDPSGRERGTVESLGELMPWYDPPILSICSFHTNSGSGKREAHINWSMVTCQGRTRLELP